MKQNIEVEGKELALKNQYGDLIIIPKEKVHDAKNAIKNNNNSFIDEMALGLPYMEEYAEDGTLIPSDTTSNENGTPIKPPFEEWYKTVPENKNDTTNYDLRQAYNDFPYDTMKAFAETDAHLGDKYKKPNHPTFSNESMYSNDSIQGGSWIDLGNDKWGFEATQHNVNNMGGYDNYKKWFAKNEPNSTLILPDDNIVNKANPIVLSGVDIKAKAKNQEEAPSQEVYKPKRSESEFYRLYSNAVGLKKDAKKAEYGNGWVLTYPNGSTEFISNRSKSEPPDTKDGVTKEYKENYEIMPARDGYKYKKNKNGYLYKDVSSTNPKIEYEGDKAINIAKFAFAPLFLPEDIAGHNYNTGEVDNEGYIVKEENNHHNSRSNDVNIIEAKNNSLKDLTTYFYSFDGVTKEEAKNKATVFYNNNIKPLVESDYYKYRRMGIRLGRVDENRGKDEDWFTEISKYNKKNNANISNDDMLKGLIEYNIKFRKLSEKDATELANESYKKYLVI